MNDWLLGIDGGGSKTMAVATDLSGQKIACFSTGASNYHSVGISGFNKVINDVLMYFEQTHSLELTDLKLSAFCLAGIDCLDDERAIKDSLRTLGFDDSQVLITNDAIAAFYAGTKDPQGIVIIAGTGSIGVAINEDQTQIRVGGWGYMLGDEGSGYWLGLQALNSVMKVYDGRLKKNNVLGQRILNELCLTSYEQIVNWAYNENRSKRDIARIAEFVIKCADEQKDGLSKKLIKKTADEIADMIKVLLKKSFGCGHNVNVVLAGGLLKNSVELRKHLIDLLPARVNLIPLNEEPVIGAVYLALREFEKRGKQK